MTPVLEYIRENLHHDPSIEEIAAHADLSAPWLSHLFKYAFDISIGQHIKQLRKQTVERLLENESLTIKDVGAQAGFNDQGYFRRWFKAAYGQPPSKYREARLRGKFPDGPPDDAAGFSQ